MTKSHVEPFLEVLLLYLFSNSTSRPWEAWGDNACRDSKWITSECGVSGRWVGVLHSVNSNCYDTGFETKITGNPKLTCAIKAGVWCSWSRRYWYWSSVCWMSCWKRPLAVSLPKSSERMNLACQGRLFYHGCMAIPAWLFWKDACVMHEYASCIYIYISRKHEFDKVV